MSITIIVAVKVIVSIVGHAVQAQGVCEYAQNGLILNMSYIALGERNAVGDGTAFEASD